MRERFACAAGGADNRQYGSGLYEHGQGIQRRVGTVTTAARANARRELIPVVLRQPDVPAARSVRCYRANEQIVAEQELVVRIDGGYVVWVPEPQRFHECAALKREKPRERINVWKQPVSQSVMVQYGCVLLSFKIGEFSSNIRTMSPENREEHGVFVPANKQFAIFRVSPAVVKLPVPIPRLSFFDKEAANVLRPVGHAGSAHIQTDGDLLSQRIPARGNVARPQNCPQTLLPQPCGAGKVCHAPVEGDASLSFPHGQRMVERVRVSVVGADGVRSGAAGFAVHLAVLRLFLMRPFACPGFGGIAPPRVYAGIKKSLLRLPPIQCARARVECVVERAAGQKMSRGLHFGVVGRAGVCVWPDGNHKARIKRVQLSCQACRIGEARSVEFLLSPLSIGP